MVNVLAAFLLSLATFVAPLFHTSPRVASAHSMTRDILPTITLPAFPTITISSPQTQEKIVHKENIPTSLHVSNTPTAVQITPMPFVIDEKSTFIMNAINAYRRTYGLPAVQTDEYTCSFAQTRAQEITNRFNHDGFNARVHTNALPYPSYALVTENIAETPNYQDVVTLWANSPAHAENMRANTPYICVESNGNYYAFEGWRPQEK